MWWRTWYKASWPKVGVGESMVEKIWLSMLLLLILLLLLLLLFSSLVKRLGGLSKGVFQVWSSLSKEENNFVGSARFDIVQRYARNRCMVAWKGHKKCRKYVGRLSSERGGRKDLKNSVGKI